MYSLTVSMYYILSICFHVLIDLTLVIRLWKTEGFGAQEKWIIKLLGIGVLCSVSDILCIALSPEKAGLLFYLVNCLFYYAFVGSTLLILDYSLDVLKLHAKNRTVENVLKSIPMLLISVGMISSYWNHSVFYVDGSGAYQRGPFYMLFYVTCCSYIFALAIISVIGIIKKRSGKNHFVNPATFAFAIVLGTTLQVFIPFVPLSNMGLTMAFLLVFMNNQEKIINRNHEERDRLLLEHNEYQEAQLKEITALNAELEERQAQLEEATSEQESQIEEIQQLNNRLTEDGDIIQKQFSLSEAVSRDTNEIFVLDGQSKVSTTIKLGGVMVEKSRQISRDYDATWAWYLGKYVYPEDRETLAEATKLDTVLAELSNKIEYCIRYRIIVGEELRYYQVAFSYLGGKESDQIVFSFRCIDDIVRDEIEQRKHLEEANQIAEARLQEIESINDRFKENLDIIANAGFGIWRITMKKSGHHKMTADRKLQDIFGITDMDLSPEELYTYYHGRLRQNVSEIENDDYAQMSGGKLKTRILEWDHPTKGLIILSAGGTSYSETDEGMVISGYCGEITEQRRELERLNQQMEAALKQAETANKSKSDFLFSMSHDIRTPMNAIIGYANLMKKNPDDKERCLDYLSKIISSSDFLLDLINNVLEMARIESGKMVLDETPMGTIAFNDSLYAVFAEGMKQKNLAYTRSIEIWNEVVFCDSVKTREIFLNLLSNAMKYTPAGGAVHMALKELPSDREGYALMQTTITDTGIGMSAEFLPHLFEEFTREKSATENKIQGTGLGMPIVKKLVDLMGGTISVTSELGKGTTFVVRLYHRISSAEALQKADAPAGIAYDFTGKHILLAEDNDLNAEIAMEILKETGAEVDRAEDGIICIDMLRKSDFGYYDLILMDIQMPNLNGYETTEKIRCAGFDIPIIAMTANAFEEDKQNALRAGMNGHIAKPIDVAELMKALAGVIG